MNNSNKPRLNTTEEMIEVLQAHERGERLQERRVDLGSYQQGTTEWVPCVGTPVFNFAARQYRVTPKPVEMHALITAAGNIKYGNTSRTIVERHLAARMRHFGDRGDRIVKMREVVEEEDAF
jgi:hypothetical protein